MKIKELLEEMAATAVLLCIILIVVAFLCGRGG